MQVLLRAGGDLMVSGDDCASAIVTFAGRLNTEYDGPDHLGLWHNALPEHQMALITSDCVPFRCCTGGVRCDDGVPAVCSPT